MATAWHARGPTSDHPVLTRVHDTRRCSGVPVADEEAVTGVEDDAGRTAGYGDGHRLLTTIGCIRRARAPRFVRHPPSVPHGRREAPGIHELGIATVRNERVEDEPIGSRAACRAGRC